jgi:hypothetical protein
MSTMFYEIVQRNNLAADGSAEVKNTLDAKVLFSRAVPPPQEP